MCDLAAIVNVVVVVIDFGHVDSSFVGDRSQSDCDGFLVVLIVFDVNVVSCQDFRCEPRKVVGCTEVVDDERYEAARETLTWFELISAVFVIIFHLLRTPFQKWAVCKNVVTFDIEVLEVCENVEVDGEVE